MIADQSARRKFLKTAGVGLAGSALLAAPSTAAAQNSDADRSLVFPVTRFGAKGDGKALDTLAVNTAIEAAAKAGGGTVYFSAGTFLCYSIHLKSNVTLWLETGATIIAADSPESGQQPGYDLPESNAPWEAYQDFGHNHWHNSLIWGEGLENIAIVGRGLIWGKGLSRGHGAGPIAENPGVGNKAIALKDCHNVLLRDFSILHGGHFGILATGVDNFTIDNLTIDTNRDGMDIDCCRNVRISNCAVNSPWDDAIVLKSSFALGVARATEMVTVTNCFVSGNYAEGTLLDATCKPFPEGQRAYRTGRIKFGTESNGGYKNITISNCVFEGCHGLAIESVDGAIIEDVCVTNITMRNLFAAPIFIRLGARMRGPAGVPVGVIRRVTISGINCLNTAMPRVCSIISGVPGHPIEDLKLSDITIAHPGGGTAEEAALQLPEKENVYPEPTMFGTTPAQGFYIRHARNVELSGIKVESLNKDERPAFVLNDVEGADFRFLKLPQGTGATNFVLEDVRDFSVFKSKPVADTELASVTKQNL